MQRNSQRITTIGLLLGLVLFSPGHTQTSVVTDAFDPERAMAHVRMLSDTIGIRAVATPNEVQAADYLAAQFVALGLETQVQTFPFDDLTSQNVIAVKPGQNVAAGSIYIGAHYDSVEAGPGANDNASGTAVLLEAARLLSDETFGPSLIFIAFGGEEIGLSGSAYFANHLSPLKRYLARGMINMDCAGWGTGQAIGSVDESADPLVQKTVENAAVLNIPLAVTEVTEGDHASFSAIKIPAIMLYSYAPENWECGPNYHQPTDTSNTVDPNQMARIAQILLATVRDLADDPPVQTLKRLWLPLMQ